MLNYFKSLFGFGIDPEVLAVYIAKLPSEVSVSIKDDSSGLYSAIIKGAAIHPVATQAKTGKELIFMVNDAIFTMKDIPERYRPFMDEFVPPESVYAELKTRIPKKYLNKEMQLGLQKA